VRASEAWLTAYSEKDELDMQLRAVPEIERRIAELRAAQAT
jgi:hypothetical protein